MSEVLAAPSDLFGQFCALFDAGDLPGAESVAARLRDGRPERAVDVLTRLGILRRRHGQRDAAIAALLDAARIAEAAKLGLPDWFHSELSGLYIERGDWQLALEAAQAAVAVKPVLGLTIATALAGLGRFAVARARLRDTVRALRGDPTRAGTVAAACATLLAADPGPEAQAIVTEACRHFAGSTAFTEVEAMLALRRRDWDEAARLQAGLAKAGPAALQRLNAALDEVAAPPEKFAATFEAAIRAAPNDEAVLFQYRDFLRKSASDQDVTAMLAACQARAGVLIPSVFLLLARQGSLKNLLSQFSGPVATWRSSEPFQTCTAYLDCVCRLATPEPRLTERFLAVPELALRLFFLLREPRLQVIRIRGAGEEQIAALRQAGIAVEAVAAFFETLVGDLPPAWAATLATAAFASPAARQIVELDESFVGFQDRIVRDQDFPMIDPRGGGVADLFDSVKIFDRQVFSFRGSGGLLTFYAGGNMNFALFLHLVADNILLAVDSRTRPSKLSFYSSDAYMCEIQAVHLRRAARNHAKLLHSAGRAPALRGQRKRIVAIHGRAENPAHHIWNYLPPFERLARSGTIGNIAAVVPPPTRYFGTVEDLYPELRAENIPLAEAPAIDPCPFSPEEIAVQLGASFIPATLMDRVRAWADRQVAPGRREEIRRLTQRRPLIWLGLRVNDKVWVDQTAGMARLIDLVVPLYPAALILLDGFSLPDGQYEVPQKWRDAADELARTADAIRERTAHAGSVLSLVGNTLSESILWASSVDVYLTPMGSSQHKVGWYGRARGLVYTAGSPAKTPPERRQGSWEAEGSRVPSFLFGEVAAPGKRRGNQDFRTNLDNIAFAPEAAARRLLALLVATELEGGFGPG